MSYQKYRGTFLTLWLARKNTLALIRSCGNEAYKEKSRKKKFENFESYAVATFRLPRKSLYGPKIIEITITKRSFAVLYNMIFISCKSGRYMLRKNCSKQ